MSALVFIWIIIIGICMSLLLLISEMVLFNKKGENWWGAIIPIYSQIIQLKIAGMAPLLVLLYFIPFVNIITAIIVNYKFIKAYGRSTSFAILSLFFPYICYPIAAFETEDSKKVNKVLYAILTILLGTFGINKFYAGKIKAGILSIVFCWTLVPTILSIAEFIMVLTEKSDKEGKIPVNSDRRTNVLFGTGLVLFVLFIIGAIIPWESLFTNCTIFTDFNTWLGNIKIGDYQIFSNLIGAPVVVDTTYGSTTGVINAFGSWTMTDVAIFLFILTGVIALCSKIKFNDFISTTTAGIKKVLPVAITAMLISIVLVIMINSGVNVTITNWIISLASGFNIATVSLASLIGSVLTGDFYYFVSSVGPVFTTVITNTDLYGVIGLIMQGMYNLVMIIAPTSVALIIGLYYLDIPYGKWFKYIWKVVLALLVIIIVASIIVFALV